MSKTIKRTMPYNNTTSIPHNYGLHKKLTLDRQKMLPNSPLRINQHHMQTANQGSIPGISIQFSPLAPSGVIPGSELVVTPEHQRVWPVISPPPKSNVGRLLFIWNPCLHWFCSVVSQKTWQQSSTQPPKAEFPQAASYTGCSLHTKAAREAGGIQTKTSE